MIKHGILERYSKEYFTIPLPMKDCNSQAQSEKGLKISDINSLNTLSRLRIGIKKILDVDVVTL